MTGLALLTVGFHGVAGILAVTVARHRADHRPVALALFLTAIADTAQTAIHELIFSPARDVIRASGADPASVPFTGWSAVACHIDTALFLTWQAGIASLALVLFTRLRPWPVAIVWVAASLALAIGYPITRGDVLRRAYLAADLAALAVAVASFASWFRKRRPRQGLTFPQLIASLIFVTEFGALFVGAWRWNIFVNWSFSQVAYATLYALCIALQGGVLWLTPSHSPSSRGSSD